MELDLLVTEAALVVVGPDSAPGATPGTAAGPDLNRLRTIPGGLVGVRHGVIAFVGAREELIATAAASGGLVVHRMLTAAGGAVLPGFVDSHTHALFAGERSLEAAERLAGVPYMDTLARGGGILATVRAVRAASEEELETGLLLRLDRLFAHGTTTVEIKSGYGLDLETELKMLRVIRRVAAAHPADVAATFLGAHAIPPEFKDDSDRYVDLVVNEMIPAVAAEGLAEFCDVFVEKGAFTWEQGRRVLAAGVAHGLAPRLHADELSDTGSAALAAELSAVSADHLGAASTDGLAALARAGVVATYLPGTLYSLGIRSFPSWSDVTASGVVPALGTDFNPGSNMCFSMPCTMAQAAFLMGVPPEAAVNMATANAAHALRRLDRLGTLEVGKQADLVVLRAATYRNLCYEYGGNPVAAVVKRGEVFEIAEPETSALVRARRHTNGVHGTAPLPFRVESR